MSQNPLRVVHLSSESVGELLAQASLIDRAHMVAAHKMFQEAGIRYFEEHPDEVPDMFVLYQLDEDGAGLMTYQYYPLKSHLWIDNGVSKVRVTPTEYVFVTPGVGSGQIVLGHRNADAFQKALAAWSVVRTNAENNGLSPGVVVRYFQKGLEQHIAMTGDRQQDPYETYVELLDLLTPHWTGELVKLYRAALADTSSSVSDPR